MEKILITGATGLIGYNIVKQLIRKKRKVRVLVRSVEKAKALLPKECEFFQGDVTDFDSVRKAAAKCSVIYHAAGLPEQWVSDHSIFQKVNVHGTENVVKAAIENKVGKFIYTSTIDVFQGTLGNLYDESIIDPNPKNTFYERSKQDADRIVSNSLAKGLPATFIHPSGLIGPGPATSPGTNDFIVKLNKGEIPILLPGYIPLTYSEDIATGHILAEEKFRKGERYILSEATKSLLEIAKAVCKELKIEKVPRVMPIWVAEIISGSGEFISKFTGKPPLIPRGQLEFMQWGAIPDSQKAKKKLGWKPISFEEALRRTIQFLRESGRIQV